MAGCAPSKPDQEGAQASPLEGLQLRVWVVADEPLAAAIRKAQGEWNAQTGCELEVATVAREAVDGADSLACDALVVPSAMLGSLAERELIRPMSEEQTRDSQDYWAEVFELIRLREAVWRKKRYGVPFGSPVLTMYCRPELLELLGRKPPETWREFQDLAEQLSDRSGLDDEVDVPEGVWHAVMQPLGPGWAGKVLLARAAAYAKHRDNYSTWFDIATMEPLIAGPPFVRALEELVETARLGPADQLQADPADVREAFWRGECGIALAWPDGSAAIELPADDAPAVQFNELPGAEEVYDVATGQWSRRGVDDDLHVPLLATAGRLGLVSAASQHPEAALELLYWLSTGPPDRALGSASSKTTLFATSQMEFPRPWVESPASAMTAARYAALTQETLSRQTWLFAMRLPGHDRYLGALDEAVRQAIAGEKTPEAALQAAAEAWRAITEELGVEAQRTAYLHGLDLEPATEP
jgi:multiple sugar transport system substrate-binding protein